MINVCETLHTLDELYLLEEVYEQSKCLALELGFDLTEKGVLEKMKLPDHSEWAKDKKLAPFLSIRSKLNDEDALKLEEAIKNSRSASKGCIRGKILEDIVEAIGLRHGCEINRNVRLPHIAKESIDHVIKFSDGREVYVMCQMDLWNGGQQTNRAEKYLNGDNKFVCVVYNQYNFLSNSKGKKAQEIHQWCVKARDEKRLMWLAEFDNYIKRQNAKKS